MTGAEIRKARENLELSSDQFARLLGLTEAVVDALEKDKVVPSRPIIVIIKHLKATPKKEAAELVRSLLQTNIGADL